jgi:hypothetical protein
VEKSANRPPRIKTFLETIFLLKKISSIKIGTKVSGIKEALFTAASENKNIEKTKLTKLNLVIFS